MAARGRVRIGVDIGGTFTDLVAARDGTAIAVVKLSSTPEDYSLAIVEGLRRMLSRGDFAPEDIETIIHGTTVATNAILEGRGARTGLITTKGFRDVLELRRIRIPELYNFSYEKPAPLVPRRRRLEVAERVAADGSVLTPLDMNELDAVLRLAGECGIEALAICFLHSYVNPEHERIAAARARALLPNVYVTASCEILPEIREYERMSTTVVNAYVGPVVRSYLQRIVAALADIGVRAPLRVMQSGGGALDLAAVLRAPAAIVESGPAAGVVAGASIARSQPSRNAITIDMGGTTAKASLVEDGILSRTTEYEVGAGINVSSQLVKGRGHALRLPVIDISEIGAGGGSLAVVDAAGRLSVGPASAGAVPGPAAYGRGGATATLTDALVAIGYVSGSSLAGGTVAMDGAAARRAVETQIAAPLAMEAESAAHGVYLLAAAVMTRAVKAVTTFRGRDPRDCTLIAFGGNGALMAPQIAEELQIGRILVPPAPGVFSACGLVIAANERERVHTLFRRLASMRQQELGALIDQLSEEAIGDLFADRAERGVSSVESMAEMRYAGQAYELAVPVDMGRDDDLIQRLAEAFHAEHEKTFGHASREEPIDLVNLRARAREAEETAQLPRLRYEAAGDRPLSSRRVFFGPERGSFDTLIVERGDLARRGESEGPLVIEDYDATIVIPPGWRGLVESGGAIAMRRS